MQNLRHIKLILIGDVVAKLGRKVLAEILPMLQKKYKPDAVIANIENLAHGKGVTKKTLTELSELGVTAFTGGNHAWKKEDPTSDEIRGSFALALPANDPRTVALLASASLKVAGETLHIISLEGQLGMNEEGIGSPFLAFDQLYDGFGKPKLLLLDFHAEMTSEKGAMGFYADGRASVVYGTHTHIPTADARILAGGTGFITDIGMTGSNDSVLGVDKHVIIDRFLGNKKTFEYPESGPSWLNAIYCELDPKTGHCTMIKQVQEYLTIN
ncbi:MAG: YmdB family metallophosphoesterase [Candidatus Komeilibacteria bacterium]|nr:YmdB family metallophosphoesterase [Candidatus Komeilibacteria bacterium]